MNFKKGFTLLEILMVLAILGVLVSIIVFNLRPRDIRDDSRRIAREGNTVAIDKALRSYSLENKGGLPFEKDSLVEGVNYSICKYGVDPCPTGSIDLDVLVDEGHIGEIPIDENNDTETASGYVITKDSVDSLIVEAVADIPPTPTPPPDYHLAYSWGGEYYDLVREVEVDSNNNIFVAGRFEGTTDFDNTAGTDIKTSTGGNDVFLTKYNSDGTYGWTKTLGAQTADTAEGLAFDSQNNIYITGYVGGTATIDFNPDAGVDNKSVGPDFDAFITKFNEDGSYGWTQKIGASNSQYGFAIDVDTLGNIYITGQFDGTVDFNPFAGTDNITSNGTWDTFLTKINSDLTYGYTYRFGGTGSQEQSYGVSTDSNNNVFLAHSFPGTFDMDPTAGTDNKTATGYTDIAVTKINANGTYGWTYAVGGNSVWGEAAYDIDFDASNNIYILGEFGDVAVDFDHGAGTVSKTGSGIYDIFLTKLNSNGTHSWTNTIGGSSFEQGRRVKVVGSDVYISGHFNSSNVDFDPTAGSDVKSPVGSYDTFFSKYGTDGTYDYTYIVGSTGEDMEAYIDVDSNNNIIMSGIFYGTVDFDLSSGTSNKTSNGEGDIFVMRTNGESF